MRDAVGLWGRSVPLFMSDCCRAVGEGGGVPDGAQTEATSPGDELRRCAAAHVANSRM